MKFKCEAKFTPFHNSKPCPPPSHLKLELTSNFKISERSTEKLKIVQVLENTITYSKEQKWMQIDAGNKSSAKHASPVKLFNKKQHSCAVWIRVQVPIF